MTLGLEVDPNVKATATGTIVDYYGVLGIALGIVVTSLIILAIYLIIKKRKKTNQVDASQSAPEA